ncbi:hypothetical protein H6F86_17340 [Phormidium sp. FACHB-592]|uniref:Transposase n=1 Tax=Stenomitos frigidus AS-A4 TaxID=2933935 RepID=A0ABV0KPY4_9CYAN|nr:hypothetical protein [Phormidium sp. FACHB-592]MBD2075627.1 hypothetical protein [Phormidium sp. FACHB-592]
MAGRFVSHQVEAYIRRPGSGMETRDVERGKSGGSERSTVNGFDLALGSIAR